MRRGGTVVKMTNRVCAIVADPGRGGTVVEMINRMCATAVSAVLSFDC